ncbi:unnamed protein product [Rotaria sordida]|uniref:F-box domain-containing protein n=1 Tax=Rotaria sordida TaxID=392033 RepID=A0A815H9F2_9BILA|nr:unnamed protein product [Rotaria sordida]CAF1351088.1 unnamed protein product [Rotaria sordida]
MEHLSIKLDDLPDEILLIIFKKLDNFAILYSLTGVNKRLHKIAHDPDFTSHLTLFKHLKYASVSALPDSTLSRFCLQIVPEIHHKIKWLNVEPASMEHIFLAKNYPNLYGLGVYGIDVSSAISLFTELHVSLEYLSDCLYFLDGRFNALRVFHVNVLSGDKDPPQIINRENLPNLRYFSLYCTFETVVYDELIIPLLCRMLNLEQLDLDIVVESKTTFIDGNDLKENIINHMSRLNTFTFSIRSLVDLRNQTELRSNEDIQHTFKNFKYNQIISYVDHFQEKQYSQCHIYSYPNKRKYWNNITNNFPGGLYKYVREVSLYDERPFEHEYFLRIGEAFPFMEELTINNKKPQMNKLHRESKSGNEDFSIIKYPHLTRVKFLAVHDDYVEQFLVDTTMCLPNNVFLAVCGQALERVTENFTRNTTRINCAKLRLVYLVGKYEITQQLKDYFPHTNVVRRLV